MNVTTEMDTLQIARSIFRGVVPKDGLPTTIDGALPAAFVCNTDDGDEPGKHWIALYLDADGRDDYFCSYGLPPRHERSAHSRTNIVPSGLIIARDFSVPCVTFVDNIA